MKTVLYALGFTLAVHLGFVHAAPARVDQLPARAQLDEQAWQARDAAVNQTLRKSDRPLDWALAAMPVIGDESSPPASDDSAALLQRALAHAPDDALVLWLVANRALASGDRTTAARSADALKRLEPDNAAAWIPALALASRQGNAAGIDDALAHMAAAARYDDHFAEALRAWMGAYDRHLSKEGDAGSESSGQAFTAAMAKASAFALPSHQPLSAACKDGDGQPVAAQRRAHCTVVGQLVLQRGTTLVARSIGAMLLERGGNEALTDADRTTLRKLEWLRYQSGQLSPDDDPDSAAMRAYAADWNTLDDEVEIISRARSRAGLPVEPPLGWSAPRGS